MKCAGILLPAYLVVPIFLWAQTGADCASAIPLTMDGVCRTYSTSSTIDAPLYCSYTGNSPVTYFSFTTNSAPDRVLIDITGPSAQPMEVVVQYYSNCGNTSTSNSMCFDDGEGLWSFRYNYAFQPNSTYILRVKTATTGNITMCAKYFNPPNDECSGAISIGGTPVSDNNACATPGTDITAAQLCASTLENTAWYQFYVAADGNCVINISNINCDNGNLNNNSGFQIGYFTGNCTSLNNIGCESNANAAANSFVQFTTPVLTAGTKVNIAIDGNSGSRCSYDISGINILGVLSTGLEDFTGWKREHSNFLRWTMRNETDGIYDIERSKNGREFISIGKTNSKKNETTKAEYSFEDHGPFKKSFYRIKKTDISGKVAVSNIIQIVRDDVYDWQLNVTNPVRNSLIINLEAKTEGKYDYRIVNAQGQIVNVGNLICNQGLNQFSKQIPGLAQGQYWLQIRNSEVALSKPVIKIQ